jgi:hypothetical protein
MTDFCIGSPIPIQYIQAGVKTIESGFVAKTRFLYRGEKQDKDNAKFFQCQDFVTRVFSLS